MKGRQDKVVVPRVSPGDLIVFEGPDEAGKTTLAQALTKNFRSRGLQHEYHSFPARSWALLVATYTRYTTTQKSFRSMK